MARIQARQRFLKSPALAATLVLVALFLARSVWLTYPRAQLARRLNGEATTELAGTEERQRQLAAEIATLQSERGIEATIRSKFAVVKAGEKVITVVSSPTSTLATSTKRWWEFWK
ncbi:MAG: septum formation initiator family protein [Candidatus Vogelbacteria bacterium]|nr:septum formation initiator family protein [Candidatus Vogelbacteria bacterium]